MDPNVQRLSRMAQFRRSAELAREALQRSRALRASRPARAAERASSHASVRVLDGPLTPRQQEVALLLARGYTNARIAEMLVISEGTAANHVANILEKLGCASRTQVAIWAVEQGLTRGA